MDALKVTFIGGIMDGEKVCKKNLPNPYHVNMIKKGQVVEYKLQQVYINSELKYVYVLAGSELDLGENNANKRTD